MPHFDHETLDVYRKAVGFCAWVTPVLDKVPSKTAARDQLDRASTSIVLNLAEGNGKRSHPDRCRYLDIARGSALESAACLDVLIARGLMTVAEADPGKSELRAVVSMIAGLIARFGGRVDEEQANYAANEFGLCRRE